MLSRGLGERRLEVRAIDAQGFTRRVIDRYWSTWTRPSRANQIHRGRSTACPACGPT